MNINILLNYPFYTSQVDVITKKLQKINELEFLIINLVKSSKDNAIPKDKTLSEVLKNQYNIDSKFNRFLHPIIKNLIDNGTIIFTSNNIKDNIKNELSIFELFMGDFDLNEHIEKNFNNSKYYTFNQKIHKTFNTIVYTPLNYKRPDYDFEVTEKPKNHNNSLSLNNNENFVIDQYDEIVKNNAVKYINHEKIYSEDISISNAEIINMDINYVALNGQLYFEINNSQPSQLVIRASDLNSDIAINEWLNNNSAFMHIEDDIVNQFLEKFSILKNIEQINLTNIDNEFDMFKHYDDFVEGYEFYKSIFNTDELRKHNITIYKNELCFFSKTYINGLIKGEDKQKEINLYKLILSKPINDIKEFESFQLKELIIDQIKSNKFNIQDALDSNVKIIIDLVEQSFLESINKGYSFFGNKIYEEYISSTTKLLDEVYKNLGSQILTVDWNSILMKNIFKKDQNQKKILEIIKKFIIDDNKQKIIWENYDLSFDGKNRYFNNSAQEDKAYEIFDFYNKVKDINPSDYKKNMEKYEDNCTNWTSEFSQLKKYKGWIDMQKYLNEIEKKLSILNEPLIKNYEEENKKISSKIRDQLERTLHRFGYTKHEILTKKPDSLKELLLEKEDIKTILNINSFANEYHHYNPNTKDYIQLKKDYDTLINYFETIKDILKNCKKKKEEI